MKFLILLMSFVNLFRSVIFFRGVYELGRLPNFRDGIEFKRTIIDYRVDEAILLFGHFLFPFIALILLGIVINSIVKKNKTSKCEFAFAIFLIVFEFGIRFTESYDFVLFD